MWTKLLTFFYPKTPAYWTSDQVFINEWEAAIDMYGQLFSGLTLVVTTGSGLPHLSTTGFTVPKGFSADCPTVQMDCAAETTILSYFEGPSVGGPNAKATQTDGMKGSGAASTPDLGVPAVKLASLSTEFSLPSGQILGGAQFGQSFKRFAVVEGCTTVFPPAGYATANDVPVGEIPAACLNPNDAPGALAAAGFLKFNQSTEASYLISPEQAEYNVLNWYFTGTPVATSFGATTNGTAPLNYLQIYAEDIIYANSSNPATVVETGGATESITAQDLLNLASEKLFEIGSIVPAPGSTTRN
jgi:hypothetical protein